MSLQIDADGGGKSEGSTGPSGEQAKSRSTGFKWSHSVEGEFIFTVHLHRLHLPARFIMDRLGLLGCS